MFGDPSLKLSEQWDRACDYLDEDIASGYVRVLQELIAASWHDAEVAKVIRAGIMGWIDLIVGLARAAEEKIGPPRPLLGGGSRRDRRLQLHRRRKPVPARPGEEGLADPRSRCGASAISSGLRKDPRQTKGEAMRAKLPDQ